MPIRGRRFPTALSLLIAPLAAFVLLLSQTVHVGEASVQHGREYHIEKYLRERTAWLNSQFPVADEDLDAEIAKFVLAPVNTTVRDAKTAACKRQFVTTYKRFEAGMNRYRFNSYCPFKRKPAAETVLSVQSSKDLETAKKIIQATTRSQGADKAMNQYKRFMLAVSTDGGEALLAEAKQATAQMPWTRVVGAAAMESNGLPLDDNVPPVREKAQLAKDQQLIMAYAIFVSPSDPPWRIHRLLKSIYTEQDFFFLHYDGFHIYDSPDDGVPRDDDDPAYKTIVELCKPYIKNGNLKVEGVFDVSWGGVSMLNAELAMFQALQEMGKWDYMINLSSTDLPLQTRETIVKYFSQPDNYGRSFVRGSMLAPDKLEQGGIRVGFAECEAHSYRVYDNHEVMQGVYVYAGSSWMALHYDFIEWLTGCLEGGFDDPKKWEGECEIALAMLDYGQHKVSFEETYFQTVIYNSPFCSLARDADFRHTHWIRQTGETDGCLHAEEIDWCGNSPRFLNAEDWKGAHESHSQPPLFFARKFRNPADFDVMDATLGLDTKEGMSEAMQSAMAEDALKEERRGKTDPRNVLVGKRAKASSQQAENDNYAPARLVDGDMSTRWSSAFGEIQNVTINLEDLKTYHCNLNEVLIHFESAYAMKYTMEVSTDLENNAWTPVYVHEAKNRVKGRSQLKHSIPLVEHAALDVKGIRFLFTERATQWGYSIWEIEALGSCTANPHYKESPGDAKRAEEKRGMYKSARERAQQQAAAAAGKAEKAEEAAKQAAKQAANTMDKAPPPEARKRRGWFGRGK